MVHPPQPLVSPSVELQPLCPIPIPEPSIRFVPDIPYQSLNHVVRLDITDQLVQKRIVVCPIAVIPRPDIRIRSIVHTPYIMREQYELSPSSTSLLVILQSGLEAVWVFCFTVGPTSIRCWDLSSTRSTIMQSDVCVAGYELIGLQTLLTSVVGVDRLEASHR